MSALRLGRLPDGTRDVRVIDDGCSPSVAPRGFINAAPVGEMMPSPIFVETTKLRAVPQFPAERFNGPILPKKDAA